MEYCQEEMKHEADQRAEAKEEATKQAREAKEPKEPNDSTPEGRLYAASSSASDQWLADLKRAHDVLDPEVRGYKKVKIAILDSGIGVSPPDFTSDKRIKGYKSWVEPLAEKTAGSGFQASV